MEKFREVVKYGNSWCIRLAPIDLIDYNISEGDMVDIEPSLLLYLKNKKKK